MQRHPWRWLAAVPRRALIAAAAVGAAVCLARASAPADSLLRATISCGAGNATGGPRINLTKLACTLGQPNVGTSGGGDYRLGTGFWHGGFVSPAVDAPAASLAPLPFRLYPTFPNPCNPITTVVFDLPSPRRVRVRVYNLRGERVRTLLDEDRPGGRQRLVWEGRDERGAEVASGVYVVVVQAGADGGRQKISLVR